MVVVFPRKLDHMCLRDLFAELDATRDDDDVTIDFSRLAYSWPTGILVTGSKLREWVNYRHSCGYESSTSGIKNTNHVHSYLRHLGFFDFIGMDEGNRVGEARGGATYIPITRISRPAINVSSAASREEWFAAIDEEARRVAGVLAGSFDDSEPLRTYKYSIREIIRNVFEHSQVSECFIFAQRWPDGSAEIAIVDEGVGIAHTLAQSHGAKTDAESLQLAVQPGVSRTSGGSGEENIYENSGFGLYVLSELAASFGWFMLGSGSAALFGLKQTRVVGEVPFH
jgi:anti-sigma regulatory factor (Ser/Thr protein kinase)